MNAIERRQAILEALCERRQEKPDNLVFEFGVSKSTIRNDILELSLTYPIYTMCGRYTGGIFVDDDFYLGKQYLSPEQIAVLEQLSTKCDKKQQEVLSSIIKKFGRKKKEV